MHLRRGTAAGGGGCAGISLAGSPEAGDPEGGRARVGGWTGSMLQPAAAGVFSW